MVNQEFEQKPQESGREEADFLVVRRPPAHLSAVSWDRFIVASSCDMTNKLLDPNTSNLSPCSLSRENSAFSPNSKERLETGPLLDTNIDFEELLKNYASFNRYYEEKLALQRKKTKEAEKKTALHAALGMPYAEKVDRCELRSFERLQ